MKESTFAPLRRSKAIHGFDQLPEYDVNVFLCAGFDWIFVITSRTRRFTYVFAAFVRIWKTQKELCRTCYQILPDFSRIAERGKIVSIFCSFFHSLATTTEGMLPLNLVEAVLRRCFSTVRLDGKEGRGEGVPLSNGYLCAPGGWRKIATKTFETATFCAV